MGKGLPKSSNPPGGAAGDRSHRSPCFSGTVLAPRGGMSTFQWFGDVYPFPPGFEGLGLKDWYMRFARIQDRLVRVHELNLPEMLDAQGDPLDPKEVLLIRECGFLSWGQFEAFRDWSGYRWAHHMGEEAGSLTARMTEECEDVLRSERAEVPPSPAEGRGGEPIPFEAFVQVQEAMNAVHRRGGDVVAVLTEFGLTPTDFGNLGAYWNKKMQAETMTYHQLYSEYSTKYRALYGGA